MSSSLEPYTLSIALKGIGVDKATGDIIEKVVREQLGDAIVHQVMVEESTDLDGDAVFRIHVVFDDTKGRLDPSKTVGLARHTRSKLTGESAQRFPMFYFVARSEAGDAHPAAA